MAFEQDLHLHHTHHYTPVPTRASNTHAHTPLIPPRPEEKGCVSSKRGEELRSEGSWEAAEDADAAEANGAESMPPDGVLNQE